MQDGFGRFKVTGPACVLYV